MIHSRIASLSTISPCRSSKGRFVATLAACALTLTLSSGCSKGSDQGGGSSSMISRSAETSVIRDSLLLTYLPPAALGYYVTDFSLESAKTFSGSPWSGSATMVSDSVKKLVTPDQGDSAMKALALLEELETDGLIPSPAAKGKLNSFMFTFVIDEKAGKDALPGLAVYEDFVPAEQIATRLGALEKRAVARGVKTQPVAVEGGSGFSTELTLGKANDEAKPVKTTIYLAAKGPRLMLTTAAELINKEFLNVEPSKSTRLTEMKADALYQKALAAVPAHKDEFAVSYLDTSKLLRTMIQLSPEMQSAKADIEKLPVGPGFMSREMNGALIDRGAVILTADAQKPNVGIEEIRKTSAGTYATQLPPGLVGFVSLDGSLIRSIVRTMAETEQKPELKPMLDKAMSIQEVGIALRGQQGASPLPELLVALDTPDAAEISQMISGMISAGAGGQGFLSPFQKKEVQGVQVEYAMSPFGAGVFVASSGNQVMLSTSEAILSELISGSKDKKALALQDLGTESKELLGSKDSLGLVHVDYTKVTGLVQGLSASLGIFTGGKPLVEEAELQKINAYGQTSATVAVVDDSIRFTTRTEPAAKPKA